MTVPNVTNNISGSISVAVCPSGGDCLENTENRYDYLNNNDDN